MRFLESLSSFSRIFHRQNIFMKVYKRGVMVCTTRCVLITSKGPVVRLFFKAHAHFPLERRKEGSAKGLVVSYFSNASFSAHFIVQQKRTIWRQMFAYEFELLFGFFWPHNANVLGSASQGFCVHNMHRERPTNTENDRPLPRIAD